MCPTHIYLFSLCLCFFLSFSESLDSILLLSSSRLESKSISFLSPIHILSLSSSQPLTRPPTPTPTPTPTPPPSPPPPYPPPALSGTSSNPGASTCLTSTSRTCGSCTLTSTIRSNSVSHWCRTLARCPIRAVCCPPPGMCVGWGSGWGCGGCVCVDVGW